MAMTTLGALIKPKPPEIQCRTVRDFTGIQPGSNGHVARLPNSDYKRQILQYNQRKEEFLARDLQNRTLELAEGKRNQLFSSHCEQSYRRNQIKMRVAQKLAEMNSKIPKVREKLRQLFVEENKKYGLEILAKEQEEAEENLAKMKRKVDESKRKDEMERARFVYEKRLQQTMEKSDKIRSIFEHHNLLEAKQIQLIQMQEKELEKKAEAELNQMWHELKMKTLEGLKEREDNEKTARRIKELEGIQICNQQIADKKLLLEENKRRTEEDRIEMNKLLNDLREEQRKEELKKHEKVLTLRESFQEQLREKLARDERIKENEAKIDAAYNKAACEAMKAEQSKIIDQREQNRREIVMFRNYLDKIAEAKKRDEEMFMQLTTAEQLRLEARQMENLKAMCDYRKALKEEMKKERDAFIKRREQAEAAAKDYAQREKAAWAEVDTSFEAEKLRKEKEKKREYAEDLRAQMQYEQELKCRSKKVDGMLPKLAERLDKHTDDIIEAYFKGELDFTKKNHPFQSVLRQNF